jgi:hypothetical protein
MFMGLDEQPDNRVTDTKTANNMVFISNSSSLLTAYCVFVQAEKIYLIVVFKAMNYCQYTKEANHSAVAIEVVQGFI